MNKKKIFVMLKIMDMRLRSYISPIQFIMIAYMFIVNTGFNIYLTFTLIGVSGMILALIDYKLIFPMEQNEMSMKNPAFVKLLDELSEIKELLNDSDSDRNKRRINKDVSINETA